MIFGWNGKVQPWIKEPVLETTLPQNLKTNRKQLRTQNTFHTNICRIFFFKSSFVIVSPVFSEVTIIYTIKSYGIKKHINSFVAIAIFDYHKVSLSSILRSNMEEYLDHDASYDSWWTKVNLLLFTFTFIFIFLLPMHHFKEIRLNQDIWHYHHRLIQ